VPGDGPDTTGRLPRRQAVILVGFMGAGKSSVGRVLAEHLGWTFEDLDDRIERRERRKVTEIFRDAGEAGFRHAEHEDCGRARKKWSLWGAGLLYKN